MDKAKEIFFKYDGSYYQMCRDGAYDEYKRCNIPKEKEKEWFNEILQDLSTKIENTQNKEVLANYFDNYGFVAVQAKNKMSMQYMLSIIQEQKIFWDTNTLFRCVNTVLDSLSLESELFLKKEIVKKMLTLLKYLVDNPIDISEDYKVDGVVPEYLSDEKILANIKATMNYCKREFDIDE